MLAKLVGLTFLLALSTERTSPNVPPSTDCRPTLTVTGHFPRHITSVVTVRCD